MPSATPTSAALRPTRLGWLLPTLGVALWLGIEFGGPVKLVATGEAEDRARALALVEKQLPATARALVAPWPLARWSEREGTSDAPVRPSDAFTLDVVPLYPELWTVALGAAADGRWHDARVLFGVRPPGPSAPDPYLAWLDALIEDGRPDRAAAIARDLPKAARNVQHQGLALGEHVLHRLAMARIRAGDETAAARRLRALLASTTERPLGLAEDHARSLAEELPGDDRAIDAAIACWVRGLELLSGDDSNETRSSFASRDCVIDLPGEGFHLIDGSLRTQLREELRGSIASSVPGLEVLVRDATAEHLARDEANQTGAGDALLIERSRLLVSVSSGPWPPSTILLWGGRGVGLFLVLGGALVLRAQWRAMQREVATSLARSRFVDLVSHELRTPLAALSMKAELLASDRLPPEKQRRYRGALLDDARRVTTLVNRILDFSRMDREELSIAREPVQPRKLVAQALRSHRAPLAARGQVVRVSVPRALPPFEGDATLLLRALENLLDNAAKYASPGEPLALEMNPSGKELVISLEDRGPGLDPVEYDRVFEPFHRVSGPNVPGTGLGLAFVARVALAHGGHARATATPTGGSRWSLHLPLTANSDREAA